MSDNKDLSKLDKLYVPGEDPEFPPEFVSSPEEQTQKINICGECDDMIGSDCKHCECNVFVIAYLNIRKCPIGKF
jgi:hypothetical protein